MHASLAAVLVQGGQATAEAAGHFEPFYPGLIILLPLIGFLLNGVLALRHGVASATAVRGGGAPAGGPGSNRAECRARGARLPSGA